MRTDEHRGAPLAEDVTVAACPCTPDQLEVFEYRAAGLGPTRTALDFDGTAAASVASWPR